MIGFGWIVVWGEALDSVRFRFCCQGGCVEGRFLGRHGWNKRCMGGRDGREVGVYVVCDER